MTINLQKDAAKVGLVLAKRGVTAPPTMRVAIAMDISGSMWDEFRDGKVQKITDQLLAVGVKFDDDGAIDVFQFDDKADYVGTCLSSDHGTYVATEGMGTRGGTAYGPIARLMTESFFTTPAKAVGARSRSAGAGGRTTTSGGFLGFGKKTITEGAAPLETSISDVPVLAFIITDGEPLAEGRDVATQYANIRPAFEAAQAKNIYFQMVGVSNQSDTFEVIERLADDLPNVGFIHMDSFNKSSDELYEMIISDELVAWVKRFIGAKTASA